MSFLERFKRKPSGGSAPSKETDPAPRAARTRAVTPVADTRPAEPLPLPVEPKYDLHLDLGDFLPRIQPRLLHTGRHAAETKLTFDIDELADRIARGQTSIRLTEIYRRVPEIFCEEIYPGDETEIRFPWQKILRLLVEARSLPATVASLGGLRPGAAVALSEKFRGRRSVRNIIPGMSENVGATDPVEAAETAAAGATDLPSVVAPTDQDPVLNSPLLDDEKLTREELLRARDAMRAQLRRAKTEHENQVSIFAQERQKAVEDRQRFVSEMMRLKKVADEHAGQAQFEKAVAAKAADSLNKVREANVALGKQVAELSASKAVGRPPNEVQGQLDELLRQVATLESNQREAALALGREKEAKTKLEQQLVEADRLTQEGASRVEQLLAATSRDVAKTQQQGAAEAAQAIKDLQEKLAAAHAAREGLAAELATARARVVEVPVAVADSAAEEWEGRAVAQLEADIARYRHRIKGLLAERESLVQEKEALHGQLTAGVDTTGELSDAHAQLTRELATVRTTGNATITVLRAELQTLTAERDAAQKEGEKLLVEMDRSTTAWIAERAALEAGLENLRAGQQTHAADLAEGLVGAEKFQNERAALEARATDAERELAKLRARVQQTDVAVASAEVAIRHHDEAVAALRAQHEQAVAARESEHAAALAASHTAHEATLQALVVEHEEKLQRLSARVAQLTEIGGVAQRENAVAVQGVAAAEAEADRKFAAYQREREGLLAERRTLLAELESAKDALQAQGAVFDRELKLAERQRDEARDAATADREKWESASASPREDAEEAETPVVRSGRPHRGRKRPSEEGIAAAAPQPADADADRLKIQRVRPVSVRPPQVQTH